MAPLTNDESILIEKLVALIRNARQENMNLLIVNRMDDAPPMANVTIVIPDHPDFIG